MILFGIGCCLVGGGLKGMVDGFLKPQRRPLVREHSPVQS